MNVQTPFSSFSEQSFFLADDGTLYGWGSNHNGATGVGDTQKRTVPTPVLLPKNVVIASFACGQCHTILLTADSQLYVWGRNAEGQLGLGDRVDRDTPELLEFPTNRDIIQIRCGSRFSCALLSNGHLYVWGENDRGQLGLGDKDHRLVPTLLPVTPLLDIQCGWLHMIGMGRDGKVYGWGYNEDGEFEFERSDDQSTPVLSSSITPHNFNSITSGSYQCLAQAQDGSIHAWGWNFYGQMGQGHENVLKAVKRVPLKHVTCIAAGGSYSLAQTEDGTLYSWGKNYDGQLGQGHSIHKSSPSPVQFPPEAGEITGFGCCCDHAFAITTRGVLYLWGSGTEGRLGNGAERSLHSPTAIEGMKFTLPKSYLYILWKPIFRWLFLGRGTPESPFSDFPVEVVYQFVVALF